jgi:HSP20 family protein
MRLMRWQRPDVSSFDPFNQLTNLRDEINRLFELPLGDWTRDTEFFGWSPAIDLYEDKDNFVVKAELPGLKKEDIDISLHEGSLIISGERKVEGKNEDGDSSRSERFFGRFQRALALPKPVDPNKVKATYKDGIVTVSLAKTEEAKPKQITVKPA